MPLPLSPRTRQILTIFFQEPERSRIGARLVNEAAENLPFHQDATPEKMERIRFSILKLLKEIPGNEDYIFRLALTDWRDLFMAAEFGFSATEHERWHAEILRKFSG